MYHVTLKEIAAECGVTPASVSKALHYATDIGQETAERIRKCAAAMGYAPNAAARMLKTSRSHNIGLLYEDCPLESSHEYFSDILTIFKSQMEARGYDITFISKNFGKENISYMKHASYRMFDGIFAENADFTSPEVRELLGGKIPAVAIDYPVENSSSVMSDNRTGMKMLVEYAYSLGHRKIAYIHGNESGVARIRLESFREICDELHLDLPPEYIMEGAFLDTERSRKATSTLLMLPDRPTCILYPDDVSAIGGITEVNRRGLKCGKDVSLAGYDGAFFSSLMHPKLTTIKQDTKSIAYAAADLLVSAMENPEETPKRETILPILQKGETIGKVESN